MAEKKAQEDNLTILRNIWFYYSIFKNPTLTKDASDRGTSLDPENPNKNAEYAIKVVMPEATYKKLKKKFKGCTNFKNAKEFEIDEFKEAFHTRDEEYDGNMPDFGEGVEELVLVKFAQKAQTKAGKDMRAPELIGIVNKNKDHNGLDVNQNTLVGNGSKGHIQLRDVDFGDNGIYLYPQAVCITELVPYVASGAKTDYSGFGIEEVSEEDLDEMDENFEDNENF